LRIVALPAGAVRVVSTGDPPSREEHRNDREPEQSVGDQRASVFGLRHIDEIEYAAFQM
jgi:hypothetical protein